MKAKIANFFHWKQHDNHHNLDSRQYGKYAIPFFLVIFFLVLVPIIIMVLYSFITPIVNGNIFSFTLKNLFNFFAESNFLVVFGWTVIFALIATAICLVIGFPITYYMAFKMKKRNAIILLITMPIWMNSLLKTLSIRVIVELINPALMGTTFVMILGMVFLFLPFMILSIYNVLVAVDKNLLEASSDLGASNFKTLRKIIFPLSIPGIINGCILVFLPALTTLIIPQYLGNGSAITIAKIIEIYFINGSNLPMGAAVSLILGIFSLVIVLSGRRIQKKYTFSKAKK